MNAHATITDSSVGNMTSKGQVLIPKAVRDRVGLKPGEPVTVGVNGQGQAVVLPTTPVETVEDRRARIRKAIEAVAGTIDTGFATTDEYMDFIRPYRHDPV